MLHSLASGYIDTGKVQVIYKHFAYIGQESQWAAEASECASEQSRFWDYTTFIYARQAGENRGQFSKNNLKMFASQLGGLNLNAFNTCLDDGKYTARIQEETNQGKQRGVRATPSFFFNGQFMEGLPPAAQFTALIDSLLKK